MKRILFLSIASLAFFAAPSLADVTVEQTTDAEYLINSGFSQAVAEDVFMLKNRANGNAIEPLYEKSQNKFVKGWRKFYHTNSNHKKTGGTIVSPDKIDFKTKNVT